MAIQMSEGFSLLNKEALDSRILYANKEAMLKMEDYQLYDGCLATIAGDPDHKIYQFWADNEEDPELGKWREFKVSNDIVLDEPEFYDIPCIYFRTTGPTAKTEGAVPNKITYRSSTNKWTQDCTLKVQGNSSAAYPKKNYTLKLEEAVAFKYWGEQKTFVLKADWIDCTHLRNVCTATLFQDLVTSREDFDDYPKEYKESPLFGLTDGFPVRVFYNGVYHGLYSLIIPKKEWCFNMSKKNPNHFLLQADIYDDATLFRGYHGFNFGWFEEIKDEMSEVAKTRMQEAIKFVVTSTDEEFREHISDYFYVSSLIDMYIFAVTCGLLDSFCKNVSYMSYDGKKMIVNPYDLDTCWGLYWNGNMSSPSMIREAGEDMRLDLTATIVNDNANEEYFRWSKGNFLFHRVAIVFHNEIRNRYRFLRDEILSNENILSHYEKYHDKFSDEILAKDYAESTAGGAYINIPSKDTNTIEFLRSCIISRLSMVDKVFMTFFNSYYELGDEILNESAYLKSGNLFAMMPYNYDLFISSREYNDKPYESSGKMHLIDKYSVDGCFGNTYYKPEDFDCSCVFHFISIDGKLSAKSRDYVSRSIIKIPTGRRTVRAVFPYIDPAEVPDITTYEGDKVIRIVSADEVIDYGGEKGVKVAKGSNYPVDVGFGGAGFSADLSNYSMSNLLPLSFTYNTTMKAYKLSAGSYSVNGTSTTLYLNLNIMTGPEDTKYPNTSALPSVPNWYDNSPINANPTSKVDWKESEYYGKYDLGICTNLPVDKIHRYLTFNKDYRFNDNAHTPIGEFNNLSYAAKNSGLTLWKYADAKTDKDNVNSWWRLFKVIQHSLPYDLELTVDKGYDVKLLTEKAYPFSLISSNETDLLTSKYFEFTCDDNITVDYVNNTVTINSLNEDGKDYRIKATFKYDNKITTEIIIPNEEVVANLGTVEGTTPRIAEEAYTIEWDAVENARGYIVYKVNSSTNELLEIGKTSGVDNTSFNLLTSKAEGFNPYIPNRLIIYVLGDGGYSSFTNNNNINAYPTAWNTNVLFNIINYTATGKAALETDFNLLDEDKDFTIILTAKQGTVPGTSTYATIVHNMDETKPWPGLWFGKNNSLIYGTAVQANTHNTTIAPVAGGIINYIMAHKAGTNIYTCYLLHLSNSSASATVKIDDPFDIEWKFEPVTSKMVVGGYRASDGTLGRYWTGDVIQLAVLNHVVPTERFEEVARSVGV